MESLPPPPPVIRSNIVPLQITGASKKARAPQRVPVARHSVGQAGKEIHLLTNHFKVNVSKTDGHYFQYNV